MQREKLYNFYKTTYFIAALFLLKMDKIFSDRAKTSCTEFGLFVKTIYCINCRAFHVASSGIFCFFNKTY